MKILTIALALASMTIATAAYAASATKWTTSLWTGKRKMVQKVNGETIWKCEYNFNGKLIWRLMHNSCPSSIEIVTGIVRPPSDKK